MKKTECIPLYVDFKKLLRIMKVTALLVFVLSMHLYASSYGQTGRISIEMKSTFKEVIERLEQVSGYHFVLKYDEAILDKVVSVKYTNESIEKVLDNLLEGTGHTYKIVDRYIAITPGDKPIKSVQQQVSVSGKVNDASGLPLPGVTVVVKGTSQGSITDLDGNYTLQNVPADAILVFSFVGMKTTEILVEGKNQINIVMEEESIGLDEVVAIGYGVTKKSDLTGSVASVTSESFKDHPVTEVTSALQGRAAGVQISNLSGAPGGTTRIRIRGANSITGGNNPLFVIDGIQLSSFNMNDLNPSDVENIEILKDASATAIYGSRGANGVIIITTKKGKSDKADVNFTVNYGISNRAYKYDFLDPVSYANQVNQTTPDAYSQSYIQQLANGGGADWQDAVFQTGETQDYQLSVGKKVGKSSYFVSGRYLDQKGIMINSNFKKYSIHSKIDSELSDNVSFSLGLFLNRSEGFNNQSTGSLRGGGEQALIWGPAEPIYDEDGSYHIGDSFGALGPNPVANLLHEHQDNISNSALINGRVEYKITDYLTLEILAGFDTGLSESSYINSPFAPYGNLSATKSHNSSLNVSNSNILTFHKDFADLHDLTVTGVYEQSKSKWDGTRAYGQGSPFTEALLYNALQVQESQEISSSYGMSRLRSYVGRVNYIFNDKYLVTASFRADGSSKFPNNKWGYFPSAALGWRLSEEPFIMNLGIFSNLKLRGGYGVTGNQGVGPFVTIPNINFDTFANGTQSNGVIAEVNTSSADQDLKWEQTAQTDIGFDMGFFNNRLSFSADYFNKQTKDLLLRVPNPIYMGGGSNLDNVGSVENKGYEFVLSGVPVNKRSFKWDVSFNFSTYQNKVVDLGGDAEFLNSTIGNLVGSGIVTNEFVRNIVGESMGTFWGHEFLGIYQQDEAAEAATYGLAPGDSKYLDLNNDGAIDGDDKMIIGHATPKGSWGLNNLVTFGNFEFNLFIHSVYGNDVFNMDYALASTRFGDSRTITSAEVKPWTPENPSNKWPKLTSGSNKEILASSKWLQDASFVRIKNVSLAYRLPKSLTKDMPVKLSVSAQNLLTFTKYKGYDPEAAWNGGNDLNQGIVSGAYPSPRVFTFSLNVNF